MLGDAIASKNIQCWMCLRTHVRQNLVFELEAAKTDMRTWEGKSDLLQQILSQELAKSTLSCSWHQVDPGERTQSYKIQKMIFVEKLKIFSSMLQAEIQIRIQILIWSAMFVLLKPELYEGCK